MFYQGLLHDRHNMTEISGNQQNKASRWWSFCNNVIDFDHHVFSICVCISTYLNHQAKKWINITYAVNGAQKVCFCVVSVWLRGGGFKYVSLFLVGFGVIFSLACSVRWLLYETSGNERRPGKIQKICMFFPVKPLETSVNRGFFQCHAWVPEGIVCSLHMFDLPVACHMTNQLQNP